jgi:TolB-like protein/Flp pilus assembly protein TadD
LNVTKIFAELKRRNVFRVGVAYAVVAWILLQATDVIGEILELPAWGGKLILLILAVCFPLSLVFAWAFEMTPEGLKREKEVDRSQSIAPQTGRKLDRSIIALLVLVAGYFIWESRFAGDAASESGNTPEKWATEAESPTPATNRPAGAQTVPKEDFSIAVLPFANRSRLEDDAFFTEGIHDDLLTQLAKVRGLKVISRTSVMKYRDTEKSIPEIAEELQVATILEGGLQRAGKRIRINAQLINVKNDQHLWAETFDREMTVENIFEIQTEITRQIVSAVRGEMTEEEKLNLGKVPTNNLEAYEAYLQAVSHVNRADYAQENFIEAESWARRAVQLDPEFAHAWAVLVEVHGQATWLGYDTSPERFAAAANALEKAKQYGPGLAETLAAEAEYIYRIEEDFPRAVEKFQQAHLMLPGDAEIMHSLAVAQRRTTDLEGALESFSRSLEIDPHYSRSPPTAMETLVRMDALDRAEKLIDPWMRRFPDVRDLRVWRAMVHLGQGDLDLAKLTLEGITPFSSNTYFEAAIGFPFWAKDPEAAIAVWDVPQIALVAGNRGSIGQREIYQAWAHRYMGNDHEANTLLEQAIDALTSVAPTNNYHDGFESALLGLAYALSGQPELAVAAADKAIASVPEEKNLLFGIMIAQVRAQVLGLAGQREAALAEIERLLSTPYRFNKWQLTLDPRWDFFRDDERFNDLIRPEGVE